MKRKLSTSFFMALTLVVFGQDIRYDTIRYAPEHFKDRVTLFKKEPVRKDRIIFLGNSITEFGDWRTLLNDSRVINRGIAADNTFGVLDRLEDVIGRKPRKLFIEIGINDIAQNIPNEIVVKNILTIVERVKKNSPATKIYVHSIFPTNDNVKNEYPDAFNKNKFVTQVNEQIRQASFKNGFTYVDFDKELKDKDGKLDTRFADPDGLHLNAKGYEVWAAFLRRKKYL